MTDTFVSQNQLDFHLLGVLLPYDVEKLLNDFLEDSYIRKYKYVLVITGKGRVVKPLVQKFLKQSKFVDNFSQAGYFNGQSGAFEVCLKA